VNYYPHHIGDYLRDTAHLTPLEDGIYRRLLDVYYASEKPLPPETQWVCKLVRARTDEELTAVSEILRQFFIKTIEGWRNKRADIEIRAHHRRAKTAKDNGKRGGRPRNPVGLRKKPSGLAESELVHNPIESSQNQNQNQKRVERASRLLPDWQASSVLREWAVKERPDLDIEVTISKFRDHWTAKPGIAGRKLDWDATFRNWVRNEKPGTKAAVVTGDVI